MKEKNYKDESHSKSDFLLKFSGKLNIITKHGQIRDQSNFKLPLIHSPSSKRSNTMLFRISKKSLFSSASQCGRSFNSKSAIINNRAQKYLFKQREKNLVEISNSFLKNPHSDKLKHSRAHHYTIQPLSAVLPSNNKGISIRHENIEKYPSVYTENNRNSDYSNFLNQLDVVDWKMKSFTIAQVLFYNPTLKSKKKKPIESDIQQAKIIGFYPSQAPIQQKCNTVGMAEGVYCFCDSLLPQEQKQKTIQTIFMNECCLVQKQVQENIWIFLKLDLENQPKYKQVSQEQSQIQIETGYIFNSFTEQILEELIDHFYLSFRIFYGKISAFLFLQKIFELQKTLDYFVPKYQQINSYPNRQKKLNISSYMFKMIRAIPLDLNSCLKFDYFKNVMQSYESSVMDLMVFANGYLAFSSLDKKFTQFFTSYLFGCIDPYKFQHQKIANRFQMLSQLPSFNSVQKYGSLFNSILFGFQDQKSKFSNQDPRSSIIKPDTKVQDLLGMEEIQKIDLLDTYLAKNDEEVKYKLNIFIQKGMVFLTFYKEMSSLNQLIFANRFFHDNINKFLVKINEIMSNLVNQNDNYRFLFFNESTCVGKCTIKDWQTIVNQIKYTLMRVKRSSQGQLTTTFQNHWIYGLKRMNRVLLIMIPNQVPLHKIQQFTSKMTKQYFYKCFM